MAESQANSTTAENSVLFARRRGVPLTISVLECPYGPESAIPWRVEPTTERVDVIQWVANNSTRLESMLCEHGAILFRGFSMPDVEGFRQFVDAASSGLVKYRYRASPRREVADRVYTSTEYPADQRIFPHNEHAFSPVFPRKLFFYCDVPAASGGETPIGSGRRILDAISTATRQKFRKKGVMYIRNYGEHLGLPWQTVFQTDDPADVETYCRDYDIRWRWKPEGKLFTEQVGPAFVKHPVTGEELWFNHATFFHVTTLSPVIRETLCSGYAERDLPNHTYYGDGSAIEPETLDELRAAYEGNMVKFQWRQGDVLLLDNMLVAHAREPFEGSRRILVGMAEPVEARAVSFGPTL